jgi:hypothetical protein
MDTPATTPTSNEAHTCPHQHNDTTRQGTLALSLAQSRYTPIPLPAPPAIVTRLSFPERANDGRYWTFEHTVEEQEYQEQQRRIRLQHNDIMRTKKKSSSSPSS